MNILNVIFTILNSNLEKYVIEKMTLWYDIESNNQDNDLNHSFEDECDESLSPVEDAARCS